MGKRLQEIEARKLEIRELLESDSKDLKLEDLEEELRSLEAEKTEIEKRIQIAKDIQLGKSNIPTRTIATTKSEPEDDPITTKSLEYRKAFMDYVLKGNKSDVLEYRADATTFTTDIGTVIPQTIIEKIVEKMTSFGMIWERVTKTNVRGGVSIPTSNVKPVATWVGEGVVSEKQKKATGEVIFAYHKLQCRVAVTLEADTVSLDIFEQTLVENIYEAMIVAIEESIVAGSGIKQPLGITKDASIPVEQTVGVKAAEIGDFKAWNKIVAEIPLAYENRVVLTVTKKTWDTHLVSMTDTNGQPVARVNYGISNKPERRFLGYEVILVEDYLPTYDAALADEVFAFFVDYKEYMFNSNLQFLYRRYFDEDTDEFVDKATLIADGKLVAPHSVLLLTKDAAA